MSCSKNVLLRGPALLSALQATKVAVKLIYGPPPHFNITPERAILIAQAGIFEGKVRNGRVHFIRDTGQLPLGLPLSDPTFWDGRSVIRFARPVDKNTVRIWDQIFKRAALAKGIRP